MNELANYEDVSKNMAISLARLTVIIFNQTADILTMVDVAIIHYEYTASARIRVGKWHLFWLIYQ